MVLAVWAAVAALGVGAAGPVGAGQGAGVAQTRQERGGGVEALLLPLVGQGGAGAVVGAHVYEPGGGAAYQHALGLQTFFGRGGQQEHALRYDGPSLFGSLRLEGRLEYRHEVRHRLLGEGSPQVGWQTPAPVSAAEERDGRARLPGGWVRVRSRPLGSASPLQAYVGYGWRRLAREDATAALEGDDGTRGQVSLGLLWDTREGGESDPRRGGVEEVALRASGHATGSATRYVGFTLAERRYVPLTGRLTFAQRLLVDLLVGNAPEGERALMGGVVTSEGATGPSSVRGPGREALRGRLKAVSNSELRYRLVSPAVAGSLLHVGLVGFADVGRAWGREGGMLLPSVGAGVRLARRAVVLRVDYGVATDSGRGALCIGFGHLF